MHEESLSFHNMSKDAQLFYYYRVSIYVFYST